MVWHHLGLYEARILGSEQMGVVELCSVSDRARVHYEVCGVLPVCDYCTGMVLYA